MKREQFLFATIEYPEDTYYPSMQDQIMQNSFLGGGGGPANFLPFNEWRLVMQERHRFQTITVLQARCAACTAEKQYQLGIRLARYWLEIDPLNEAALRSLMAMLAGDGRAQEALRQYERYTWWLTAELNINHEPTTQSLAAEIAAQAELPLASKGA
jgi:DNA-binding SARP family transcriptional activator